MQGTLFETPTRDLGGFDVRRVLPLPNLRAVGPFVFFDHMGPARFERGEDGDVRPHPHIGLATLTWLFDGEIVHRDSLGTVQSILPGEVNWMVAGDGIVHSERSPQALRGRERILHGLQAWLALPLEREDCAPSFVHVPAADVPRRNEPGIHSWIVAGDAWGLESPVPVDSRMLYVVAELETAAEIQLPEDHVERAVYVCQGEVSVDGVTVPAGSLVTVPRAARGSVRSLGASRIALIGGDPLDAPRFVWWNFVASSRERIEQAKARWERHEFPGIDGETERIPLPA
jgi:redox-sensitive bicupin YhaK (pirin superfamily)